MRRHKATRQRPCDLDLRIQGSDRVACPSASRGSTVLARTRVRASGPELSRSSSHTLGPCGPSATPNRSRTPRTPRAPPRPRRACVLVLAGRRMARSPDTVTDPDLSEASIPRPFLTAGAGFGRASSSYESPSANPDTHALQGFSEFTSGLARKQFACFGTRFGTRFRNRGDSIPHMSSRRTTTM